MSQMIWFGIYNADGECHYTSTGRFLITIGGTEGDEGKEVTRSRRGGVGEDTWEGRSRGGYLGGEGSMRLGGSMFPNGGLQRVLWGSIYGDVVIFTRQRWRC